MKDDDLWKIYDINKDWIKFADSKSIAFIAIIGVTFNILYAIKTEISISGNLVRFLYIVSISLLSISLLLSVYCLIPRTSKSDKSNCNVIYYKDINDNFKNEEEYYEAIKKLQSLKEQLTKQIYQLAVISTKKYSIIKLSLIFFALGFLILVIIMIML